MGEVMTVREKFDEWISYMPTEVVDVIFGTVIPAPAGGVALTLHDLMYQTYAQGHTVGRLAEMDAARAKVA